MQASAVFRWVFSQETSTQPERLCAQFALPRIDERQERVGFDFKFRFPRFFNHVLRSTCKS